MRHNGTSRYQLITVVLVTALRWRLERAAGDPKDEEAVGASSTTASQGSSYSTQAFIVPFDVMVPDLFPTEATTDTANFVTWETATAVRPRRAVPRARGCLRSRRDGGDTAAC